MNVGDLVTLSTAGKKIQSVTDQHKRFFRGPESTYYGLCKKDRERFDKYWKANKIVGLVLAVEELQGRGQYDWHQEKYVYSKIVSYRIAWQANPEALATTRHSRSHLKFVKKHKKK